MYCNLNWLTCNMEIPVEHEDPLAWGDVRDDDGQRERAQDSRPLVPSSL